MHLTSNFSTKNKPAYHTFLKGSHSNTFPLLDFAYLKDPFQLTFEYHSNVLCAQLAQVLVRHGCWGRSGPRFLHTCYRYCSKCNCSVTDLVVCLLLHMLRRTASVWVQVSPTCQSTAPLCSTITTARDGARWSNCRFPSTVSEGPTCASSSDTAPVSVLLVLILGLSWLMGWSVWRK